jgi:hypothetical protein
VSISNVGAPDLLKVNLPTLGDRDIDFTVNDIAGMPTGDSAILRRTEIHHDVCHLSVNQTVPHCYIHHNQLVWIFFQRMVRLVVTTKWFISDIIRV